MGMRKYGDAEDLTVVTGKEAAVIQTFRERTGKAVSDLDESELEALRAELKNASEEYPEEDSEEDSEDD